jgi:hypothetical protein
MTLPTLMMDMSGSVDQADGQRLAYDTMTNTPIAGALQPYIVASSIAPTFSAPKGTICIALNGSSATTRVFINTNGTTGWTSITTAT